MHTFAQKQKSTQKTKSASSTMPSRACTGQSREVSSILYLQRKIGNHDVLRMLQPNREKRVDRSFINTSPRYAHELIHTLQQLRLIDSGAIQTKLAIGQPNDIYEQEASRVADEIMCIPDTAIEEQPKGAEVLLQANALPDRAFEVHLEIETQINSQKGGGQRLPESSLSFFGSRFGHDFEDVRVHTGSVANQLNKQLDSRAFTTGNHIFFREGEYNPDTSAGKGLLAHELTHVVQQRYMNRVFLYSFIQGCGPFTVGQGSHTADCGYFCAYFVMLNSHGGHIREPQEMTQQWVYDERDAFRQSRGLRPGHYFLTVENVARFLNFLGLRGYRAYRNVATPRYPHSVDGFKQRVQNSANRGGGVILLLGGTGSTGGHYIAVLRSQGRNLCCYNPANPRASVRRDADRFAQNFWNVVTYFISR